MRGFQTAMMSILGASVLGKYAHCLGSFTKGGPGQHSLHRKRPILIPGCPAHAVRILDHLNDPHTGELAVD